MVNFRTFPSPPKETPYALTVSPHSLQPLSPTPRQPQIYYFLSLWLCLIWAYINGIGVLWVWLLCLYNISKVHPCCSMDRSHLEPAPSPLLEPSVLRAASHPAFVWGLSDSGWDHCMLGPNNQTPHYVLASHSNMRLWKAHRWRHPDLGGESGLAHLAALWPGQAH